MITTDTTDHPTDEQFASYRSRSQERLFSTLPDAIDRLSWDGARLARCQRDRLRTLLATAIERSPFHARRLRGIEPSVFELDDLRRLPVMTKPEMMADFDHVVTDRRVTRTRAEQTVTETSTTPRPIEGEFVVLASGGSSGTRGLFVFDPTAFAEFASCLLRTAMARLQAAGGPPPGGLRIAFVAASSAIHATGCAPPMLEGAPVAFDPIPVTQPLGAIVARLNELQPPVLYGYPSMLARLAHEQTAGRLRIAPMSISATSETLRADLRQTIRDAFGAPVVNVYGASEGLAGATPPDDPVHTFASDSCIVELVDEHDDPVPPGVASASILVTNLFNLVQPLIRYRIEDRFVARPASPDHGHLRAEVQGRAAELFRYGALDVHPLVVASPLTKSTAIVDYQIRQTPAGVDIDVIAPDGVDGDVVAAEVRDGLIVAGLVDPVVHVRTATNLARDPKTGKLRMVIPLPA